MSMVTSEIQQVKLKFGIIGNSEGLNRAIDIAIQVAPTDLSVLITGESGVGKEHFPKIIYDKIEDKSGLELIFSTSDELSQEDLIKEKEKLEKEKERIINRIRDIDRQLENKKNSL